MAMTITADDVLRDLLTTDEGKRDPYPLYRERFAAVDLLDDDPPRASSFLRGLRSLPVRVYPR